MIHTLMLTMTLTVAQGKDDEAVAKQRVLADDFMHRAAELALEKLKASKDKEADKAIKDLQGRMKGKFFGGPKTDAAQFQKLLKAADEAKVKIQPAAVRELVKSAVHQQLDDKALKQVEDEVLKKSPGVTSDALMQAVANEFRVRIMRDLSAKKKS